MSTVKLVPEDTDHPQVARVFADFRATKKIDFVPSVWRAMASNPDHWDLCWTRVRWARRRRRSWRRRPQRWGGADTLGVRH
jgi:hypothetical protein